MAITIDFILRCILCLLYIFYYRINWIFLIFSIIIIPIITFNIAIMRKKTHKIIWYLPVLYVIVIAGISFFLYLDWKLWIRIIFSIVTLFSYYIYLSVVYVSVGSNGMPCSSVHNEACDFESKDEVEFDNCTVFEKLNSDYKQQTSENKEVIINTVQFSAIVPKKFIKGQYTLIDIIMYEEEYRNIVDTALKKLGSKVDETNTGFFEISKKSKVSIILESPDFDIEDNMEQIVWNGKYSTFRFSIFLPNDFSRKQIAFCGKVYVDMLLLTKIKFVVKVSSMTKQKIHVNKCKISSAFISYASQDRNKVVARIQGMKKVMPDVDIFFDVESLRSGQEWETVLWDEIEKRDILYLFWSSYAKKSEWVNKEWKYALNSKGIDAIEPVPLEAPDICPPPEELAKKHFNDWTLRYSSFEAIGVGSVNYAKRIQLRTIKNEKEIIEIDQLNYTIGRINTDIIIPSSSVSRLHAKIVRDKNDFFVIDEDSTNGTYINNRKLESQNKHKIKDGDILKFADCEYEAVIY